MARTHRRWGGILLLAATWLAGAAGMLIVETPAGAEKEAPEKGGLFGLSIAPDEISPRLFASPDGQVYRTWYRTADERTGGGAVLLAKAAGEGWQLVREIRPPEPGVSAREPKLALGPGSELLLLYRWWRWDPRSKELRLARSADGGSTWTLSPDALDGLGRAFEPQIDRARNGTTLVVWSDEKRGRRLFDIYGRRSADGGQTWDEARLISRFAERDAAEYHVRPLLAGDGAGRFWVVWTGFKAGRSSLFVSGSTDDGRQWSDPRPISGNSRSVFASTFQQAGDHLLAVWQDKRTGADRVYSASSADAGATWSDTAVAQLPADSPAVGSNADALVSADGKATVAWQDNRNGRDDIYLTSSTDGGRTWAHPEVRVDGDEPGIGVSRYASLAQGPNGRIAVAWEDDRSGHEGIFVRLRGPDGQTWTPEERLTPEHAKKAARLPRLLWAPDGTVYVAWEVWDYTLGPTKVLKTVDGRAIRP